MESKFKDYTNVFLQLQKIVLRFVKITELVRYRPLMDQSVTVLEPDTLVQDASVSFLIAK